MVSYLQKVVRWLPKQRSDDSMAVRPIASELRVCNMKNSLSGVYIGKTVI